MDNSPADNSSADISMEVNEDLNLENVMASQEESGYNDNNPTLGSAQQIQGNGNILLQNANAVYANAMSLNNNQASVATFSGPSLPCRVSTIHRNKLTLLLKRLGRPIRHTVGRSVVVYSRIDQLVFSQHIRRV